MRRQVSVRGHFSIWTGHQHASRHPEMNNELARLAVLPGQAEHNMLSDSVHPLNAGTFQGADNFGRRMISAAQACCPPKRTRLHLRLRAYLDRWRWFQLQAVQAYRKLLSQSSMTIARDLLHNASSVCWNADTLTSSSMQTMRSLFHNSSFWTALSIHEVATSLFHFEIQC